MAEPQTAAQEPQGTPGELQGGRRIAVIGPDGMPYSIPADEIQTAIGRGARIETPQEQEHRALLRKAAGQSGIPVFASSLAESLPFIGGYAAKGVRALSGQSPEEAEAAEEMHPIAGLAGTATGAIGQAAAIAASGGLEGLAEGAGVLGEEGMEGMSLAGRTAVHALAGGTEGALYSTGGAVNEAVLNNHPLTAEMLLERAAGGALFGASLAGGLSVAGEGLEHLAEHAEKVGTAERAAKAADLVGADLKAMEDAGVTPGMVNRAFKEGIFKHGQSTPLEVQTAVAQRMGQVEQKLGEIGTQLEQSGQTVNLLKLVKDQAPDVASRFAKSGILTETDETAGMARAFQLRKALLNETGDPAAAVLLKKVDQAIASKAGNVSEALGESAKSTMELQRDFLHPIRRLADEAVQSGHMPSTAGRAFESIGREGGHLNAIHSLAGMAGLIHPGAGFLGLAAGNILRRVAGNPGGIAETFLGGLKGITKATQLSSEELNLAVQAAVEGTHHLSGHLAEVIADKTLPHGATDEDVQRVRQALASAEQNNIAGGHPAIASALNVQRSILAQALPLPKGNPNVPAALARPALGPTSKEITRYNSTLRVLADPMGTVANVGKGKATVAEVRTLAQAYPQLSRIAGQKMLNYAAERGKPVTPAVKRAIEVLHSTALDPATTGAKVARVQTLAFAPAKPPGNMGSSGGQVKPNAKGLANLDIGDRISAGMMQASDKARRSK